MATSPTRPRRRRPIGLSGLELGPAIGTPEPPPAQPPRIRPGRPRADRPESLSLDAWREYERNLDQLPADEPGRPSALEEARRMVRLLSLLHDDSAA